MAAAVEQLKKKATPFRTAISHKSGLRATPISISMDTIVFDNLHWPHFDNFLGPT